MPVFRYKAATPDGEVVEGSKEATEMAALVRELQDSGYVPIRVEPEGSGGLSILTLPWKRQGVGHKEVLLITQELSTLLHAGLSLDRSLRIVIDLSTEESVRRLLEQVLEKVRAGAPLSRALDAHPGVFSRFYLNMLKAGEAGGSLEVVLARLAEYLERSKALRDTVVSALIYPAILLTLAIGSLFILLAFVVPQFTQLFADSGKALPLATQIVIVIAEGLRDYGWVLILLVAAAVWAARRALADPARRHAWDTRLLNWPMIGDLLCKVELARLARTLGTLLRNGVTLLPALSIVRETLENRALAEAVETAAGGLREGRGMSQSLLATGRFPRLGMEMIRLGEETGQLDEMLLRVADTYDQEVRTTIQRLLTLLEPILIVGLGILIGGIIMSILMAILSVNELAF